MLDTTNALGGANGVVFDDQWQWLIQVLKAGSSRYLSDDPHHPTIVEHPGAQDVLFVIHCHHTISTMDNGIFPPDTTFYDGHALENLLLRFPNVILMVDGHNHKNTITAHQRPWAGTIPGGFWEVTTASHIDWPIQSRLLEITSGGGVISVFTTLMDPDTPLDWRDENLHTPKGLASLARELAANDLQQRDHGVLSDPDTPKTAMCNCSYQPRSRCLTRRSSAPPRPSSPHATAPTASCWSLPPTMRTRPSRV